jgi:hypothetical protein
MATGSLPYDAPEEAGAAGASQSPPVLHRLRPHETPHPTLAADTDPAAERVQLAIYRDMTPARKVQLVLEAIQLSRDLALAGLRTRHPGAGPDELRRRLYGLELGEELASRIYGPLSQFSGEP